MAQGRASTAALVADIRRVARLLNHSPSSIEYARYGRYDVSTVRRRFKTSSWAKIIGSLGLQYATRTSSRCPTMEEVRRDIMRVAREVGHAPTCAEYETRGEFGVGTARRRARQRRWEDVVAALTDIDPEEIKLAQAKNGRPYRATYEWLAKLRDLAADLGRAPTTAEANSRGINASNLRARVGGGWEEVLRAAGVNLCTRTRQARLRSTPTEEMMADVRRVARRLGRAPTMKEYARYGRFKPSTVRSRHGGWRRVRAFTYLTHPGGDGG